MLSYVTKEGQQSFKGHLTNNLMSITQKNKNHEDKNRIYSKDICNIYTKHSSADHSAFQSSS